MEILRNNTNTELELLTNIDYDDAATATVLNLSSGILYGVDDIVIVMGGASKAAVLLPAEFNKYDFDGYVTIFNDSDDIIFETGFSTVRPYCSISDVATTLNITELQAKQYERLARYVIDSKTGGFKFTYKQKEVLGLGTDILLIDEKIHKLFKLYQNEELIYDVNLETNEYEYFLNVSKTGIIRELEANDENRLNYKKVWRDRYYWTEFPEDYDYIVEGEFGYFVIPYEITEAIELLMNDLACGNNRYLNKYIESVDTDGFDITYFAEGLFGTGNLIVDNILTKYGRTIRARVM